MVKIENSIKTITFIFKFLDAIFVKNHFPLKLLILQFQFLTQVQTLVPTNSKSCEVNYLKSNWLNYSNL